MKSIDYFFCFSNKNSNHSCSMKMRHKVNNIQIQRQNEGFFGMTKVMEYKTKQRKGMKTTRRTLPFV